MTTSLQARTDPLRLVWMAGSGQLEGKVALTKYREKIRRADVPQLINYIRGYIPGQGWVEEFGLRKLSILLVGISVIQELQVDSLFRRVEIYFEKVNQPVILPTLGDGIDGGDGALQRRRVRNPKVALVVGAENETVEFGACSVEMDFGYFDQVPRMGALVEIEAGPSTSGNGQNGENEPTAHCSYQTRRPRWVEDDENKENIPPRRSYRAEDFPSQDEILEVLRRQARTLDPLANLMVDHDLPPQPAMEGTDFGDIDSSVDAGRMLMSFDEGEGTSRARGVLQPINLPPKRKRFDEDKENMPPGQVGDETNSDLELDPVIEPRKKRKKVKKSRRKLPFNDEVIEIPNEVMGPRIRNWQEEFEDEKYKILDEIRPEPLLRATLVGRSNQQNPDFVPLPVTCITESRKHAEVDLLIGPHRFGKRLTDWLKVTRPQPSEPLPAPKAKKPRRKNEEQSRHQVSAVAGTSTAGSSILLTDRADLSGNLLSRSGGLMTSAMELGTSGITSSANSSVVLKSLLPGRKNEGRAGSPQPQLAEESSVHVFKNVVRRMDRVYVCRYFATLLDLQKAGKVRLEQKEAYGDIKIHTDNP